MAITYQQEDQTLTAELSGELDHHAAKAIMDDLQRHLDAVRPHHVTLDLHALTFTDSSGIAVILRTWKQAQSLHASLRITRTPAQADRVFRAAGLHRIIPFD